MASASEPENIRESILDVTEDIDTDTPELLIVKAATFVKDGATGRKTPEYLKTAQDFKRFYPSNCRLKN